MVDNNESLEIIVLTLTRKEVKGKKNFFSLPYLSELFFVLEYILYGNIIQTGIFLYLLWDA